MNHLSTLYRGPFGLVTDLYELTMAYGYWKAGVFEREAAFHVFFRENPFRGGFAVACGLATVLEYLEAFRFSPDDCEYLRSIPGSDGRPLFEPAFVEFLARTKLCCDIDAVPEGTIVFPHEPLVRVTGPIWQAQILESALLNIINFQTLIATKAARLVEATRGEPVLEFGLRRAQGFDGAISASRAAYVGGCDATSNVLAGRLFGIPVKGTHAHSWVMCFDDERAAFEAYAAAMPGNALFLVDTYDTLEGVRRAVEVGRWLRRQGHELIGVRLDSGDLAYLSIAARRILDEAGFPQAQIVGSNDLDEQVIASLKNQGARISVWGVGTRLVTAFDQPALGCVYKLSAIREPGGPWRDKVKLSDQAAKTSTPGVLQTRRFYAGAGDDTAGSGQPGREAIGDMIFDVFHPLAGDGLIVDPSDPTRRKALPAGAAHEDLLVPIVRGGRRAHEPPSIHASRRRCREQLALFHPGIRRFVYPHQYPVGLEKGLHDRKTALILQARGLPET